MRLIDATLNAEKWNLGDGLENVCKSCLRKLEYAGFQTEERERTIINLDSYEITAMIWAIQKYMRERFAVRTCGKEKRNERTN